MPQALESPLSIVPWPTPSRPSHLLLPTNVSFDQHPLSRRPVVTIRTPKRKSDQPWPGDNSLACLRLRRPTAPLFPLVRSTADGNTSGSDPDSPALPSEVAFDIKLPRRSLLVEFTCDSCGERTKRLINRVAYEKGTIFLQCAGCLVYHKFVDNLGLVVEYDLREELNEDSDVT